MADKSEKEKDTKVGEADASSNKPKDRGKVEHAAERFGVQAVNRLKKPVANLIVKSLSPEMKARIAAHQDVVETLSSIVALLPPNQGILGHLTDDFQQGLANEVIEQIKAEQGGISAAPSPVQKPAFDEAKEIRRIMLTVAALPDQSKRDQFTHWFQGLAPDQRKTFLALAAASNDAELKTLVQLPVSELDDLLAALPPTPQEKKSMTMLELRAAVKADADLNKRVQDFLTALGADLAPKFWGAVERELNKRIRSLEEFRQLMSLSADEVKQFLWLNRKSVEERLSGLDTSVTADVEASGLVGQAERFRDRMKGWGDKLQAQLKLKPEATEGDAS